MDPGCFRLAHDFYDSFAAQGRTAEATTSLRRTHSNRRATGKPSRHTQRPASRRHRLKTSLLPSLQALAYVSLLMPSYAFIYTFVGGNLSTQTPYGIPSADFLAAISSPASHATFPIAGYDTSLNAGSANAINDDAKLPGWSLDIGVTANVPLTNAASKDVDKSLCFDATTLSVTPPAPVGAYNSSSWRVCAVVFAAGLKTGGSTKADGSCGNVLPDECIRQLQVNSVAGRAGRNGGCEDLDVPGNCKGYFQDGAGSGFSITPINTDKANGTSPADRRALFFAAGFEPARKGNRSALAAAERRVWPVLLAWTHFAESGEVQDSAGWLSCAKTTDSKAVVGGSAGWGLDVRVVVESAKWAFLCAVVAVGLATL